GPARARGRSAGGRPAGARARRDGHGARGRGRHRHPARAWPRSGSRRRGLGHGATCSTVFVGFDGMPVALCTAYLGPDPLTPLAPTVKLFHPDTADVLAEVQLAKGALL